MKKLDDLYFGCPKCRIGYNPVDKYAYYTMQFIPSHTEYSNSGPDGVRYRYRINDEEYLLVKCKNCGYSFKVEPNTIGED